MPILSSRPVGPDVEEITEDQVIAAAQPAVNILQWLTTKIKFTDDRPHTIMAAREIIEEALECLTVFDFAVAPMPSTARVLTFDVGVQSRDGYPYVIFQVQFQVI